jgi:hypothetical protein
MKLLNILNSFALRPSSVVIKSLIELMPPQGIVSIESSLLGIVEIVGSAYLC